MLNKQYVSKTNKELVDENIELKARLDEAEQTLNAIQNGEIDAIITPNGTDGPKVYTLESADSLYRNLIQEMNEGVATLTYDGTIFYSNAQLARMVQIPLDNIVGLKFTDFIYTNDLETYKTIFKQGLNAKSKGEINITSLDGNIIPVNISIINLKDLKGIYIVLTDLSEHKHHEELKIAHKKLNEREIKFRTLFENSMDAILLTIPDGTILSANPAAEKMFGYSEEEIIKVGRNGLVDSNDPNLQVLLEERNLTNKAKGELNFIRKNGAKFTAEVSSSNFKDENGNQRSSMAIRDITNRKKNEEAIKRQAALLNLSYEAIFSWDYDGTIRSWNNGAERLYGYSSDEAVGTNNQKLLKTEFPIKFNGLLEILVNEKLWTGELQQFTKNGDLIVVESRLQLIKDDSGKKIIIETNRDITQRKQDEEELNRYKNQLEKLVEERTAELKFSYESLKISREHYLTLFNSIDEGFCTVEVIFDDNNKPVDYKFLEVNPAFENQTGLNDASGKFMRDLAPDHEEYWFEIYGQVALTGKSMRFVNEAKALNRWYDVYAFKVGDSESREVAILFNDITKFKETEEALKSSNIYNRSLIEASIDPLVTIGSDGKVTDVNNSTENVTGIKRDRLIGTEFSDYFTEPEKALEGYKKVFKEGFVLDYPLEIKNKNGSTTPVLYNASVYKDESGEVIGVLAAARDITGIKKAEQKLKEYQDTLEEKVKIRTDELAKSNADLQQFAYIASHDLREPLRMITSFLQLLERRYKDKLDQDANDYIEFAVDGAKRLDAMIKDLLEYSKVTRKEITFNIVNIENILEQALINLIIPIRENNAIINHEPLPIIVGDENLLVLLFQNLIGNAIKYHSTNTPRIDISVTKKEPNIFLV